MKKKTKPGAMDDDAKKRAKDRKKKMEAQMNELFGDNNSGRYSGPIDK
jgi:hypothetical protein